MDANPRQSRGVMNPSTIRSLTGSNPASANYDSRAYPARGRHKKSFSVLSSARTLFRRSPPHRVRFAPATKLPLNRHLKEWFLKNDFVKKSWKAAVMSNPYVYNAFQYPDQYQHTPYYYTPRSGTPFIIDANLYNSPYSNPTSLPGTPNVRSFDIPMSAPPNAPGGVPFPSSGYVNDYAPTWENGMRQRRPSWHGNPVGPFLQPQLYPTYNRRNSFGNYTYSQTFHINPWINGQAPRGDFVFDLSHTSFLPLRLFGGGQSALLASDQLHEPATYPTLTRLRIINDLIPAWSIDLELRGYAISAYQTGPPPPITLVDVLVAVHRSLHRQTSAADWQALSDERRREVGKAYKRRCQAVGGIADYEFGQGLKRVDYLMGRTKMLGLVRSGQLDGWEVMKLIVTRR